MPRKFQFRLEVVRKLRERARDAQRLTVADAAHAVVHAEQRVHQLTEQLRQTVELNRGQRVAERVDVASLRVGEFYRNWLHHHIVEGGLHLAGEQARLSDERLKLGQASARLKAIEKLKQRRWSRYRKELLDEEQSAADEAALRAFTVRSPEAHA